jgi:FkbM family methyltransferase
MKVRAFGRGIFRLFLRWIPVSFRDLLLLHLVAECSPNTTFRIGLPTVAGLLANLRKNGFSPVTIVDVGAYVGDWSRRAAATFASARLLMIDGNPDSEVFLGIAQREIGMRAEYSIRLLGDQTRARMDFYKERSGSSVLEELTTFDKQKVQLPMGTLDEVCLDRHLRSPILLKLDVQGFELEVLRGGRETLDASEVVILETALIRYNKGAPLFAEVISFMLDAGFVVYDFCGQFRRQTDLALFQTDIVFVRAASDLRAPRKFWLEEP